MARPVPKQLARWGLIITTVALGAVLVSTGLASYLGARESSDSVVRARSLDLMRGVWQHLRTDQTGQDWAAALEDVLAETEEQGLRYVAVVDREGQVVASAGEPNVSIEGLTLPRGRTEPLVTHHDGRVRAVTSVGGQLGRWMKRRPGRWAKRFAKPDGPWSKAHRRGRGLALVIEFEPIVATAITSRALATFVASLAAAALLLGAAVVFWRLSRQAEQMEAQLQKDQQLKLLGEMSAVLGHELRNPLASLKGHAQLLLERLDESHPSRRGAATVVREAERLEALTTQILDFVRTGALVRMPEDPKAVARGAIEVCAHEPVHLVGDQELPRWPMDRGRMERVLSNLITNAAAASPEGAAVDVAVTTEGSDTLVYTVRDRGPGIAPGDERWIFEPFHTKKVKGTGLGLAVAKRIVEAHGGGISVSNHPEGGAEFRLWLPRGEEA